MVLTVGVGGWNLCIKNLFPRPFTLEWFGLDIHWCFTNPWFMKFHSYVGNPYSIRCSCLCFDSSPNCTHFNSTVLLDTLSLAIRAIISACGGNPLATTIIFLVVPSLDRRWMERTIFSLLPPFCDDFSRQRRQCEPAGQHPASLDARFAYSRKKYKMHFSFSFAIVSVLL